MSKLKLWLGALGVTLVSPLAVAMPSTQLCDIVAGAACLDDNGAETFEIIDTDGGVDTITSFVFSRNAALANSPFIYDLSDPTNTLTIFSGTDTPLTAQTIFYDAGLWTIDGMSTTFASGAEFGLGLDTGNDVWYSQSFLNSDEFDHLKVFETLGTAGGSGILNVSNLTFAWEDLPDGGDMDYNDLVMTCTDCDSSFRITSTPVPLPGTAALLGLGLFTLRRNQKKAWPYD